MILFIHFVTTTKDRTLINVYGLISGLYLWWSFNLRTTHLPNNDIFDYV